MTGRERRELKERREAGAARKKKAAAQAHWLDAHEENNGWQSLGNGAFKRGAQSGSRLS